MRVKKAPKTYEVNDQYASVFLAGFTEMSASPAQEKKVIAALESRKGLILNPRRDDIDASWKASIDNEPFRAQVEWELGALELASLIFMYLSPEAQSPVTMICFGMYAQTGKMVVCCPEGFWRKGNIEIVSSLYGVEVFTELDPAIEELQNRVDHHEA